jgi:hypothetical protein
LDTLPASVQAQARRALREIWDAEDRAQAEAALERFAADFSKWPKAVAKFTGDRQALLAFYGSRPSTGSTCAPPTRSSPLSLWSGRAPT